MNKNNTYVINLDKDVKRLENMKLLLNNNFTRFPAIYGKDLSEDTINENITNLCKYFLCNHSIIGCALSHLKLWEQLILDNSNNYYIILEDDLNYIDKDQINKLLDQINKIQYDYINLHCEICLSHSCDKIEINIDGLKLCKSIFPLTTAGYIINKEGAQKLVNIIKNNITYHIDFTIALLQHMHKDFKIFHTKPNLVKPSTNDSNINGKIVTPTLFLLDKLNFNKLKWLFSVPVFTINMKYIIPIYFIIIVTLLIIFRNNRYFLIFLYIELLFCIYYILF